MRKFSIFLLGVMIALGCSQPSDPIPKGQGEALNPSGKPRNQQEQAVAQGQMEAGQKSNAEMAAAAAAMRKARGGGSGN